MLQKHGTWIIWNKNKGYCTYSNPLPSFSLSFSTNFDQKMKKRHSTERHNKSFLSACIYVPINQQFGSTCKNFQLKSKRDLYQSFSWPENGTRDAVTKTQGRWKSVWREVSYLRADQSRFHQKIREEGEGKRRRHCMFTRLFLLGRGQFCGGGGGGHFLIRWSRESLEVIRIYQWLLGEYWKTKSFEKHMEKLFGTQKT